MYITISEYYFNKCCKFADDVLETSKDLYSFRGEHRVSKMREDIIIGKMGEIAAYQYLKARGYSVSKPDFKIYEASRKSYDADLVTECGKKVHVKAQGYRSMVRYGSSWLLQKSDKITKKPLEEEYVLMVSVSGTEADVLGIVRQSDLIEYELFESPKVSRYGMTKVALYFDTIKRSGISLEAV